ncbi:MULTISPECIES: TetR/AcrR family transcriptional regulator [unclassified Xanthobacter]|uniref:TetR/AcrR family transcriptional regulator n=1 Tax=unclassified Xanthobacter TaxID=2623496 RepID=UPI001F0267B0|nr:MULTISPECIES: TetR/AcrR family transcriptional regulator [unclassified Xanthobacter]UJX44047.1 TetR/AcrR family transcriptional regulator [Xanthobacter sp. YC-JY1]
MNVRVKETADETRERIARTAQELFRRMGFAKTAVADIAAELGMSPANVYRFFPSKNAIVATICSRCLNESEAEVAAAIADVGSPQERILAAFLSIMRYHKENFLEERRVHDMVLVAIENNWDAIEAHKARLCDMTARVLADGIAQGVFVAHDPSKVSRQIQSALLRFCHPILVAQHIDEDQEGALRESLRFILRSIEVERSPLP